MTSDWHVEVRELELNESFRIAHGSSSMRQVVRVHHGDAVGEAPFVPYYHEDIISTLRWLEKARRQNCRMRRHALLGSP